VKFDQLTPCHKTPERKIDAKNIIPFDLLVNEAENI
jgi:hypothetical protein